MEQWLDGPGSRLARNLSDRSTGSDLQDNGVGGQSGEYSLPLLTPAEHTAIDSSWVALSIVSDKRREEHYGRVAPFPCCRALAETLPYSIQFIRFRLAMMQLLTAW